MSDRSYRSVERISAARGCVVAWAIGEAIKDAFDLFVVHGNLLIGSTPDALTRWLRTRCQKV
jgi:hypothetical protein